MVQQNCQDEIKNSENRLWQHRPVWSEDLSGELQGESEGFQPTETNSTIISEPPGIGKPFRGAESNVEHYVPKEETFPNSSEIYLTTIGM